jgi:hypothetical protein
MRDFCIGVGLHAEASPIQAIRKFFFQIQKKTDAFLGHSRSAFELISYFLTSFKPCNSLPSSAEVTTYIPHLSSRSGVQLIKNKDSFAFFTLYVYMHIIVSLP